MVTKSGKAIAEQLAEFIAATDFEALPAEVMAMARHCFLDWLGSAIAGGGAKPIQALVVVAHGLGGSPEATVIPDGSQSSSYLAALVNAAASHVVEMDDLHKASVLHPGAAVIPAVLAMAERQGSSGADLIAAAVLGYEVAIRAGEAVGQSHYQFWHSTGTCGTFGAAAAAGKLLGLTTEQLAWALGTAGTQAAGLWEFLAEGAMSKQLHPARAAANGVMAALLAEQGFTGARRIFEGEKGFCRATSRSFDLAKLTDGLGQAEYRIMGNSFKVHAACYHIHSAIDAALEIRARHPGAHAKADQIAVHLYAAAADLLERVEASSPYAAKFNVPFCVATALLHGVVGLEAFTEARLADPTVQKLMGKVQIVRDPELDALYPERWAAKVAVSTRAGEEWSARVDYPKGDPKNPLLPHELAAKFRRLVEPARGAAEAGALAERSLALDSVENMATFFAED